MSFERLFMYNIMCDCSLIYVCKLCPETNHMLINHLNNEDSVLNKQRHLCKSPYQCVSTLCEGLPKVCDDPLF